MKHLLTLLAAITLAGCAAQNNKVIGIAQAWCDEGELTRCRQVARDQVEHGRRTEAEALDEFMTACTRSARRHKLDVTFCTYLRDKPLDIRDVTDPRGSVQYGARK